MEPTSREITALLIAWSEGDEAAFKVLFPLVYNELRRLARLHMNRERGGHTIQATALVHEAYLRLIQQKQVQWQNRNHFFAVAAQAMRRILVSMARARHATRRGGGVDELSIDDVPLVSKENSTALVALDDALSALYDLDQRKARVIELRFFAGLSVEETSDVLKISVETVMREWKRAKAWLYKEMNRSAKPHPEHSERAKNKSSGQQGHKNPQIEI